MEYYYLKSGLPDLESVGMRAEAELESIREYIETNLTPSDRRMFQYLLYRNDNKNLLRLMRAHDGIEETSHLKFNEPAAYSHAELESGFAGITELPAYMEQFVADYHAGALPENARARGNLLKELYSTEALALPDAFLRGHFQFKRDLKNIISALNARKFGYPIEEVLVGQNDLTQTLLESRASDFGLGRSHPFVSDLMHLIEIGDLMELERAVDHIISEDLDRRAAGNTFGSPAIFAYFIKLSLGSRWLSLTRDAGIAELSNIMDRILSRPQSWPTEYALDQRFALSQEKNQ